MLATRPSVLDDGGLADVGDLFDDVEFAEPIGAGGVVGQIAQTAFVFLAHVLDVAKPVVGQPDAFTAQYGADAAATVVSDDHDVFHAEDIDRVLYDRETIQIGVNNDVGDVTVDEDLAWQQADDFVGRHATVGAADPEVLRILLAREFLKKLRIAVFDCAGPSPVLGKKMIEISHGI